MTLISVASVEDLVAACADHETFGFHGTSSLASEDIETKGFLPSKVFSESDHTSLLSMASSLSIDTSGYTEWLGMRSVTFAMQAEAAVSHVLNGSSGGQGLQNMQAVLFKILEIGSVQQVERATVFVEKLESIRKAPPVIYAVNLSDFGQRLVNDRRQPLYQYYWDLGPPTPKVSDIGPSRLLAKLCFSKSCASPDQLFPLDQAG